MTDELKRCFETKKQGGELNDLMLDYIRFIPCTEDRKPSGAAIMDEVRRFADSKRERLEFKYRVRLCACIETGYHDLSTNDGKHFMFASGVGIMTSSLVAIHRCVELGTPTYFVIETQNSWYRSSGFEMTPELKKKRGEIKKYFPKVYEEVFEAKTDK